MTDEAQRAQDQEERQRFFNLLGEAVLGRIETDHSDAQPTIEELVTILKGDNPYPGVIHLAGHLINYGLTNLRYERDRLRALRCLGEMEPDQLNGEYGPLYYNGSAMSIPTGPLQQSLLTLARKLGFAYGEVAQLLCVEPDSVLPPVESRPVVRCRVNSASRGFPWLHEETPPVHRFGTQYEALCYAAMYAPEYPNGSAVLFAYPEGWVVVERRVQNKTVFAPCRIDLRRFCAEAAIRLDSAFVVIPGLNPD